MVPQVGPQVGSVKEVKLASKLCSVVHVYLPGLNGHFEGVSYDWSFSGRLGIVFSTADHGKAIAMRLREAADFIEKQADELSRAEHETVRVYVDDSGGSEK